MLITRFSDFLELAESQNVNPNILDNVVVSGEVVGKNLVLSVQGLNAQLSWLWVLASTGAYVRTESNLMLDSYTIIVDLSMNGGLLSELATYLHIEVTET